MGGRTGCGLPQVELLRNHTTFMWEVLYEDKFQFCSCSDGTDLQDIPPRFFQGEENWSPRTFAFKLPTGFSSFAVSENYEYLVPNMDFVSDAENIKRLIKLPFLPDSVSLLMHRVGNSVFIDNYDLSMIFVPGYHDKWKWLSDFATEVTIKEKDTLMWEGRSAKHMLANDCLHKLFYYSLKEDMKFKNLSGVHNSSTNLDKKSRENCLELPPDAILDGIHTSFLQKFSFEFLNLKFLLGSNVPVFQTRDKLLTTIRSNDLLESTYLSFADCLDSWLDNIMLDAAETIVYHRKDSKIILTEPIKTDKLIVPGSWEANMMVEKSQNLFALLKEKVDKPGHTYWFYKAPGAQKIDIYDVTVFLKNDSKAAVADMNPVLPSIANLLYRICITSSSSLPPSTVLGMMKDFLYVYPENSYPGLQSQMKHILSYFGSIEENLKLVCTELDRLKIGIYKAEATCLMEMQYVAKLSDNPGLEFLAFEKLHDTLSKIYSALSYTKNAHVSRIEKAIVDELIWRISCNKYHIANLMYDKLSVRSEWTILNQVQKPTGPEYYGFIESLLVTAIEAVNKEDNLDRLRDYPSHLKQKILLARLHNTRGILNYTIARGCGWKPENDPVKSELMSCTLYGQTLAIPTDYEQPDSTLKNNHDGGGDQGVVLVPDHLERAEISFLAAAMLYHDFDCMSEFMHAYICYVDSKMGLFRGEISNVTLCEIQLLCNLRFYLKWNFNDKKPTNVRTIVDNAKEEDSHIGSTLHDRHRDDIFYEVVKPKDPVYYIDLVWKKLLNLLALLKKAGHKNVRKGEIRGLDSVMKVPKAFNKGKEKKTEEEARLSEFKKYLADVARVTLREEMPVRQTDIPLPESPLWQVKVDGIDASGDGTFIEIRRSRTKNKRKGK